MHRRLLLLVVAALLLRGWIGESMAGQMLAQQLHVHATQAVAMHAPDCPGMAAADDGADAAQAAGASLHCQDCTLHALTPAALTFEAAPPAARAGALLPLFASAERQAGFKPPISRVSRP